MNYVVLYLHFLFIFSEKNNSRDSGIQDYQEHLLYTGVPVNIKPNVLQHCFNVNTTSFKKVTYRLEDNVGNFLD